MLSLFFKTMNTPVIESNIRITPTVNSRLSELDIDNVGFGKEFSDHMFVAEYKNGEWLNPSIMPYGKLHFSPSISALHYGQAIFEGMKAYRGVNGEPLLFRPKDNFRRMNASAARLCMPQIPESIFMEGLKELVKLDQAWIPAADKGQLYIRPHMFATDEFVGVKASESYIFVIFCCPVSFYYKNPVKLLATKEYSRAAIGGTGGAKAAGNYAAALLPDKIAKNQGYDNVLWLDARLHQYIEECGTMNVFFSIEDSVITPLPTGTILGGVTRDSVIRLLKDNKEKLGINQVEIRRVSIYELDDAYSQGSFNEAFGTGTAATIAPISKIGFGGKDMILSDKRPISTWLYDTLYGIQTGVLPDPYGWVVPVK